MESFTASAAAHGSDLHCLTRAPGRAAGYIFLVIATAACIAAAPSDPEPLGLEEALALALQDQPQLEALMHARESALQAAVAEAELPDPQLAVGVQNMPVDGNDAFRLDREDMTMVSIGLTQEIVTRAKRHAASSRMSAQAAMIGADAQAAERAIRRDVTLAWLGALEAQRRAQAYRRLASELAAERDVSAARLASSASSPAEILRLDAATAALRDRIIVAQRDEHHARAELARWIGEAGFRSLRGTPLPQTHTAEHVSALPQRLADHPALESARRAVDAAMREVELARAERRPNWSWQLMYGQRQQERSDMVSVQLAVDLPWNRADRQDRRIAEKLAIAERARSMLLDRQRELLAQLQMAHAELEASTLRLEGYEMSLLPASRARLEAAQATYAGSGGSLAEIWEARRALVEAELERDVIRLERARSLARIAYFIDKTQVSP